MALTSIELIALVFSIFGLIKLIAIIINKEIWYQGVAKPVYNNNNISTVILTIIGVVVFYFIIQEFTITQVLAIMAFSSLLIGIGFLQYSKEVISLINNIYRKKMSLMLKIYTLIWLIIILWGLYEILII